MSSTKQRRQLLGRSSKQRNVCYNFLTKRLVTGAIRVKDRQVFSTQPGMVEENTQEGVTEEVACLNFLVVPSKDS